MKVDWECPATDNCDESIDTGNYVKTTRAYRSAPNGGKNRLNISLWLWWVQIQEIISPNSGQFCLRSVSVSVSARSTCACVLCV